MDEDAREGLQVSEYDLLWSLEAEAKTGKGWYLQETPSGRRSQFFATREAALFAMENGNLRFN